MQTISLLKINLQHTILLYYRQGKTYNRHMNYKQIYKASILKALIKRLCYLKKIKEIIGAYQEEAQHRSRVVDIGELLCFY